VLRAERCRAAQGGGRPDRGHRQQLPPPLLNFGPTLLAWLERWRPEIHARVVEADAQSLALRGHGNALAQGYSHAILPLCSPRDRLTQIRWGLADFRHRFQREPEGFWLPETAADGATLEALAAEGLRFTVLSPYQARRVRPPGGAWQDVSGARFDPTRPYRVRLGGGRELVVFFYDGHIARDLAFGDALGSAERLVRRLEGGFDPGRGHPEVLTIAFDGETLGHHKKGGDETLAAALRLLARRGDLEVVNLDQALQRVPAEWEAEIAEGSSWSCAHGVGRWRTDCGCSVGGQPGWNQAWRAPLLGALERLRDALAEGYEKAAGALFPDPWATRDRYAEVVSDVERRGAADFVAREAGRRLAGEELARALKLLEMQRHSLLMFTSCGWFFAELSGLETVQVLKYAARAIQLAREAAGIELEPAFEEALAAAPSNVPALGEGRRVYRELVKPSVATLEGIGAHLAISSAARHGGDEGTAFHFRYRFEGRRTASTGPIWLAVGRLRLESALTAESLDALYGVLHFGQADFRCGLVPYRGPEHHREVEDALFSQLQTLPLARLLREVVRHFPGRDYVLRDLFLDDRRKVTEAILEETMRRYEDDYLEIFDDNRRLMEFLREIDSPIPGPLRVAADVTLTRRLLEVTGRALEGKVAVGEAEDALVSAVEVARRLGAHLHIGRVRADVEALVNGRVAALLAGSAAAARAVELVGILRLAQRLGLWIDLWNAQNQLWAWAGSSVVGLDRETTAALARALWFDEATLLARGGYAPVPADAG
jgi:hypothetical protein